MALVVPCWFAVSPNGLVCVTPTSNHLPHPACLTTVGAPRPSTSNQQPAMPDYGDLTDLQLMILSVLWSEREATIGTIHEQLNTQTPVARKTVAMILSRLEQRRLVSHRLDGREGVYKARVAKQNVLRSRMASLLGALFVGQPRLTGAHALDPADVRTGDVEKMAAMIRQLERDVKKED